MNAPRNPLEILESTPSTMDAARINVLEGRVTFDPRGAPSSWGVFAHEQTAGRGQRGRAWYSERGESLCVTYYVRHRFPLPDQSGQVALMAGVVVAGTLQALDSSLKLGLKWPNDILIGGRKAGGVLVEMVHGPNSSWTALVGVGVNVFELDFPAELRPYATSLALESSEPAALPSPERLAWAIGSAMNAHAATRSPTALAAWLSAWRGFDATTGRRYETVWNESLIAGTAEGIGDDGSLILRLDDGSKIAVTSASSLREVAQ